MKKLKVFLKSKWLMFFKLFTVAIVLASFVPMLITSFGFFEQRGREIGKIQLATVPSVSYQFADKWIDNSTMEFRPDAVYPNPDYHPYNFPAKNIDEFIRYKTNAMNNLAMLKKIQLERIYESGNEGYYINGAMARIKELEGLLASYTATAEAKFGREEIEIRWQKTSSNSYLYGQIPEQFISKDDISKSSWDILPLLVNPFLFWLLCSITVTIFYNVLKLKQQGMKIWCEVANLRLFRVSSFFFATLIVDSYPKHGLKDQLKTVQQTCATVLSLLLSLMTFGGVAKAQNGGNSGSGSGGNSKQNSYELIIEGRPNLPINGTLSKTETGFRVMVTHKPSEVFVENTTIYKSGRLTNQFVSGKFSDTKINPKLGTLKLGPYVGWRFVRDKFTREDSIVFGTKVIYKKILSKARDLSFNIASPVLQFEKSFQKKRFAFANASQIFVTWGKSKVSLGMEYSYRKVQSLKYSAYSGVLIGKRIVFSGKGLIKSISSELLIYKEIPVGDWRGRGRFTFSF